MSNRKRIECHTPGQGVCPIWKAQEAEIVRLQVENDRMWKEAQNYFVYYGWVDRMFAKAKELLSEAPQTDTVQYWLQQARAEPDTPFNMRRKAHNGGKEYDSE